MKAQTDSARLVGAPWYSYLAFYVSFLFPTIFSFGYIQYAQLDVAPVLYVTNENTLMIKFTDTDICVFL